MNVIRPLSNCLLVLIRSYG